MPGFAVIGVAKLKTAADLTGSTEHVERRRPTRNADAKRTPHNRAWVPDGQGWRPVAGDRNIALDAINARLEGVKAPRKDSVKVIELLLTASPEHFRPSAPDAYGTWDKGTLRPWVEANMAWLREKWGDRIAYVNVQLDEATPHLSVYIVPEVDGKLNASRWLDGPGKLRDLWTEYADAMAPLGLVRGIEGGASKPTTIAEYYRDTRRPTPRVSVEIPAPQLAEVASLAVGGTGYADRVKESVQRQVDSQVKATARRAKAADKAEDRVRKLEAQVDALRQRASDLRGIPLDTVARKLGLEPDPADEKNWIAPDRPPGSGGPRVTITGAKFFDHAEAKGGGGAIDFVMHVQGTDYKSAVAWLADTFGAGAVQADAAGVAAATAAAAVKETIRAAKAEAVPTWTPPEPQRGVKLATVVRYLTGARKLPDDLVKWAVRTGRVYADRFANAVFRLGDPGAPGGVELRGTGATPFHGARGKKDGGFVVPAAGDGPPEGVAFVESSIEALSYHTLWPRRTVVGTVGSAGAWVGEMARQAMAEGLPVYAAYNADEAGDRAARRLAETAPGVVRHRPPTLEDGTPLNDWNDCVRWGWVPEEKPRVVPTHTARHDAEQPIIGRRLG